MRGHLISFPRKFESQPNAKALLWLRKSATHRFSKIYRALSRDPSRQRELANRASTYHRSGNCASIVNAPLSTLGGSFRPAIVLRFQSLAVLQSDADGPESLAVTPQLSLTQYAKFALLRMH